MTDVYLSQLVNVDAGFKPAVHLPDHFEDEETNSQLLRSYIPTTQTIELLADIARSLNRSSRKRARLLHGTFGTGKSDLLLVVSNYFQRDIDDPVLQTLNDRLKNINPHLFETIYDQRKQRKPFLVVLLQADPEKSFSGFILYGLKQALERAGLGELMASTKYSAAIQKIEDWKNTSHPMLDIFASELRQQSAKEIEGLISELKGSSPDAGFSTFTRVFEAATGSEFNIHEFRQPHVTYSQVAKALQDKGTHEGILVVCDEFTWFLKRAERIIESGQREIEHEMLGVQDLANAAISSEKAQLHFIVSSLEAFASAGSRGGTESAATSLERVGGRFDSFALGQLNSEELIRGALVPVPGSEGIQRLPQRQRDEILSVSERLWHNQGHNREWIKNVILGGTFPLHPLTTYALPLINRKVAQSSRTMFLFLNDEQGLKGFLQQTPLKSAYPEWHNLLTLDYLFDYFAESIEAKRPELIDTYAQSKQIIEQANVDRSLKALADNVMKAIVICELSGDTNLSATRDRLQVALNIPQSEVQVIDNALMMLEQLEVIIAPPDPNGVYVLPISGKVVPSRLKRLISDSAKQLNQDASQLVSVLNHRYPPSVVEAAEYNREHGTQRRLNARYLALDNLNQPAFIQRELDTAAARGDGVLFYIVASSENERQQALASAREFTRRQQSTLIAVPTQPTTVLGSLRDYQALEKVRQDSQVQATEQEYLRDKGRIGKPIADALQNTVSVLGQERSWDFFAHGELQPPLPRGSTSSHLASRMMSTLYPNTPSHSLPQHIKTDSITPAVKRAAEELIQNKVSIPRTGTSKQEAAILKNGVLALGLLQLEGSDGSFDKYQIIAPSSKINSMMVWNLFEKVGDKYSWTKLVDELRTAPIGIYDSLLLLFTACFFAVHSDEIEVVQSRSRQPITVDLLVKMIEQPKNYHVRLAMLHPAEKRFLQELIPGGLKRPFDASADRGTPLRLRVANKLNEWLTSRKLPSFVSSLNSEDLRQFLPNDSDVVIAALPLFLKKISDADLSGVLLEDLPTALRAPYKRNEWNESTIHEMLGYFASVCRAIEELPKAIESHVTMQAMAVFGATDTETAWDAMYSWRRRRTVESRGLSSNTQVLYRALSNPSGNVRQALLVDFPGQITPTIGDYSGWSTLDKVGVLVTALTKAFDEIEAAWKESASQQSVWLNGIARAASGRVVTEDQPDHVARLITKWAEAQRWPVCTLSLRESEIGAILPELAPVQRSDVLQILRRVQLSDDQWQHELTTTLPTQFGIETFKQSADTGLRRFVAALSNASTIDARLRQHIVEQITHLFPNSDIRSWRLGRMLPADNDLSEDARTLLSQIDDVADNETLLTVALPRALADVGAPYGQWSGFEQFARYLGSVRKAIDDVDSYVPLTEAKSTWLRGLVTRGLMRPLHSQAKEQTRLADDVQKELRSWLCEVGLPSFSKHLSIDELRLVAPDVDEWLLNGVRALLDVNQSHDPSSLLLEILPSALELTTPHSQWQEHDSEKLVERFICVREILTGLPHLLVNLLCTELAPIFGGNGDITTPSSLMRCMREWRRNFVLTRSTQLSDDARLLVDVVTSPDNPDDLLLTRLPAKLPNVAAPFEQWTTWQQHRTYITVVAEAAAEVARQGQIGDASAEARSLWGQLHSKLQHFSSDDRRWLIKMLNDELNV